jgi:hypothetical protein
VTDFSALRFGLIRQPDRRQTPDRRLGTRGGRRASDRAGSAVSFAIALDEDLAQLLATWGPLLQLGPASNDPLAAR